MRFAAIYFDCDSTLTAIEGIDELVTDAAPAVRAEIAALTAAAMAGELPLAQVYERRLALLAPRREQVARLADLYRQHAVPDAGEVIAALHHLGKHTGILSGGIFEPVSRFARWLGISGQNVHAVPVAFTADGAYDGFQRASPLWRNGGKVEALRALPADHHPLAFVGDGITDAELRGHVARFVGFGGVVARPRVRELADVYVAEPRLAAVLPHVLAADELAALAAVPRFAPLLSAPRG
jgi:phosphoserine phosphatase